MSWHRKLIVYFKNWTRSTDAANSKSNTRSTLDLSYQKKIRNAVLLLVNLLRAKTSDTDLKKRNNFSAEFRLKTKKHTTLGRRYFSTKNNSNQNNPFYLYIKRVKTRWAETGAPSMESILICFLVGFFCYWISQRSGIITSAETQISIEKKMYSNDPLLGNNFSGVLRRILLDPTLYVLIFFITLAFKTDRIFAHYAFIFIFAFFICRCSNRIEVVSVLTEHFLQPPPTTFNLICKNEQSILLLTPILLVWGLIMKPSTKNGADQWCVIGLGVYYVCCRVGKYYDIVNGRARCHRIVEYYGYGLENLPSKFWLCATDWHLYALAVIILGLLFFWVLFKGRIVTFLLIITIFLFFYLIDHHCQDIDSWTNTFHSIEAIKQRASEIKPPPEPWVTFPKYRPPIKVPAPKVFGPPKRK